MPRARKPISKWADSGQPIPTGQPPSPAPKAPPSDSDATSAELQILQDALDNTTKECRRLTTELEGRQGAHEDAIRAKEEALRAAEDKINRIERELSEAKSASGKTGDDTYEHLIGEREKVEGECKRLQGELKEEKAKSADLQKQLDELTANLDKMRAEMSGKKLIDAAQFQLIAHILKELKDLDPAGRGVDEKIVSRIAEHIGELKARIDQLEIEKRDLASQLAAGGAGADHSAFQAEIDRLNERCTQLERIKDHVLAEKSSAEQAFQDLQQTLQEAYDRAQREETRANALEDQLGLIARERDEAKASFDDVEKLLVKLDPDTSGPLDKRNDRIIARVDGAVTPRRAFKGSFVILVLVCALITGALASYLLMPRTKPLIDSTAGSASGSASTPAEVAPPPPASSATTLQSTVGAQVTETESCYPVDANVVALFFGQELRDGKIFGKLSNLSAGHKRIKCAEEPTYDETSKQTDISECEACVPGGPGVYPAAEYLSKISAQIDPSCYTEPTDYRFHKWPSESIRFSCDELAPFDPVRNCRDVSKCNLIVPDPKKVTCDWCTE